MPLSDCINIRASYLYSLFVIDLFFYVLSSPRVIPEVLPAYNDFLWVLPKTCDCVLLIWSKFFETLSDFDRCYVCA